MCSVEESTTAGTIPKITISFKPEDLATALHRDQDNQIVSLKRKLQQKTLIRK